ncbi:protein FAM184B isoform X3 [Hemicordylus capensis]|uniref:protein FAM184B isoform X3 n=1 Tax=Hemicordylus capensis TaxID=884348 RepID=UPI00230408BC|nr:protein FAM184B isoform X3 [Hemicordylus capensis]
MASGINKVHQAGTCNGSSKATSHCSSSEEGDQEMHMKMCKKIAQLTKVIYALNTKNDEHETSIQALEEAHQEKIRHILAETRETVLQYKSKVEEEQELRKRIQTLEEALEKYRRLKGEASAELTVYKKQVEESESEIEAKCTDNIIFLPKEMLNMKLDFENRVQTSDQESDGLLNECWAFEGKRLDNKRKLRETYSMEMQAVVSETVTLKQENQKLAEEYAKQASQLQASHEREKETWKKVMQQSVADSCREWQQKEIEQRKTYEAREAASQQQIRKLEADLEAKGQRIYELKKHSQKLKEKIQGLEMQLKEAQQLTVASKSMVKTLEEELVIAKERLLLQEDEIRQKTESMETALNFQSKARGEVDELKNPSLPLQQVLSTKKDQGNQGGRDSQLREAAGSEKEAVKQQHREELRKIKQESDEEKMRLKEQLVKGLEDLVKKHTLEIKSVQASMDVERKKLQKEVQTQLEELKKKHENEIKQLQKEKEAVNGKLQDCSLEVLRLEDFIRQNQDIPKYTEFLKSHARKTYERQQEVTQLKQTLDQQANAFREALKEQTLQSSKEREKLLQDLQDTIKESQAIKAQLEASHQKAINLLEKSKTQELKKAEEHWKKEYKDSFKVQQQTHSLEIQALGEKAREELQSELGKIQKQQSQLIESLRVELSEQRASCITHKEENEQLQVELNNLMSIKKQQEGSYQNQIKSLKDEMEKCQNEISGLKKENSLLKDTMDLLSVEGELQKQTSAQLQERVNQHRRLLEEELKVKHKKELDILKQDYHKEIQNMVSDFSNSQALLHAKIVSLENEVKELDDKPRKREPGLEDVHLTGCLQDKLNEKDEMIKELMDGRKLQHALMPGTEPRRNRSFSFNTNPSTCLTPIAKQKKKIDEAPSRIVSVPNLASYAKSFLSGDLRPKRNPPQITKSTSLDQNPGCVRVCYPSVQALDTHPAPRLQNETSKPKDAQKQDPRHQEWFTKYFSF